MRDSKTPEELVKMAAKAVSLLTGNRASYIALARYMGVDNSTIHRWARGTVVPARSGNDVVLEELIKFTERYEHDVKKTHDHVQWLLSNG